MRGPRALLALSCRIRTPSGTPHLRVADNEIWIIVLDDFQPAGDFARLLQKQRMNS